MTKETKDLLSEMGVYTESKLEIPANIAAINLDLTIQKNGNTCVVFCNGGVEEYTFLGNHGAFSLDHEMKSVAADTIPYLTLSVAKFEKVLKSIAANRILIRAMDKTGKAKRNLVLAHQRLANSFVSRWLADMPAEENRLYGRELAAHEVYQMATEM